MKEHELKEYIKKYQADIQEAVFQSIDNYGEVDSLIVLLLYDPIDGRVESTSIEMDQIAGIDTLGFYIAIEKYIESQVSARSELVCAACVSKARLIFDEAEPDEEEENEEEGEEEEKIDLAGVVVYFESHNEYSVYAYQTLEKGNVVDINGELINSYRFELIDNKRFPPINKGAGLVSRPGLFKQLN